MMWLDDLRSDVRYAARALRKDPGFTGVAVLTLALGIGATTAIFSLINTLMLRTLPVRNAEQLVELLFKYPGDPRLNSYGPKDYEYFRDENHVFSDLIGVAPARFQVSGERFAPEIVEGSFVVPTFFEVLGVRTAIGRVIAPNDESSAVISWSYWQSRFSGDPAVLGTSLIVDGAPATVIGVTARAFSGLQLGAPTDVWLPLAMEPATRRASGPGSRSGLALVARLKPGVPLARATAEMRILDKKRIEENAARSGDVKWRQVRMDVEPAGAGLSILRERFAGSLRALMAVVGVLLVIACVNLAGMLLARGAVRHREMAVRVAVGAGRFRLVRQVLTESLLLSTMGTVLGLLVAYAGAELIVRLIASGRSPVGMPQPLNIPVDIDLHVLGFAAATALVTGVLFGLVPAWKAFATNPSSSLHDMRGATEASAWRLFGKGLVVAQVALSVVLLTTASVFVGHLSDLRNVGLGFDRRSVLQVALDPSRSGYQPAQLAPLYRELLARMAAIPGVQAATLSGMTPISGAAGSRFVAVEGFTENPNDRRRVTLNVVAPKYFEALRTPIVAGRDFAFEDEGRERVAIVNQAMAHYYFGNDSPIGKRFTFEGQPARPYEIVGVAGDAKYNDLYDPPPRTIYLHAFQDGRGSYSQFALRTTVPPMSIAGEVRRAVGDVVKNVPVARMTTLAEQVDASILPERMIAMLSGVFGALAALLVAIGLYGLLAYTVARRINEIGIRMALGATTRDVARMVLASALGLAGAGLVIGAPIARLTRGVAADVLASIAATSAEHPVALPVAAVVPIALAALALIAVAIVAAYVPARRATKVDPIVALRCE